MRFNSTIYVAFLALVLIVLWLLPERLRRAWLLTASVLFYGSWHYPYVVLLLGTAACAHFGGKWIMGAEAAVRRRRGSLVLGALVALLGVFKYLDWVIENANVLAGWLGAKQSLALPGWVLPLGISFYVFQAMSYVIDVVRRRETTYSFWDFSLYIAYFPQLIAGPIMRAKELLPQLRRPLTTRAGDLSAGVWLLVSGLFLKTVVADGIAPNVDRAFARSATAFGTLDVWLMAVAFGLQVYFDFSSYTRIALGSARLCGIRLVDNFDHPYVASSPVDFWNRWHVSLSRWIRDYLFYPLLGGRTSRAALVRAALLSMTICGAWHGAGWTFVAWGAYHGLLIAGFHLFGSPRRPKQRLAAGRVRHGAAVLLTFALVSLGWLLFRSQTINQALVLIGRALNPVWLGQRALGGTFYLHTAALVVAVWSSPWLSARLPRFHDSLVNRPLAAPLARVSIGAVVGVMVALCTVYMSGQRTFIYFQF